MSGSGNGDRGKVSPMWGGRFEAGPSAIMEATEYAIAETPDVPAIRASAAELRAQGKAIFDVSAWLPPRQPLPDDLVLDWLEGAQLLSGAYRSTESSCRWRVAAESAALSAPCAHWAPGSLDVSMMLSTVLWLAAYDGPVDGRPTRGRRLRGGP